MGTEQWAIGDIVMGLYEIREVFTSGGMGLVYRIHHRGWDVDLAMKSPRPEYFQTETHKRNFEQEAETWINLGLHPNIVSCYYVRRIEDIPRVFAEYLDAGSLRDWIKGRKLLDVEKILDVAIQFARGLHCAHERGLVHQDVKPANVMLNAEGVAKVTDFGLAKATFSARSRTATTEVLKTANPYETAIVSSSGMTPAYCSPEQAMKAPLSVKTDIWSWAVSIMEIFIGDMRWLSGNVALAVLEGYLKEGPVDPSIPPMPAPLVELLRSCFEYKPENRPAGMDEIAGVLKDIHARLFGSDYSRAEYVAGRATADSLNNRAVSLLDLGRTEEAQRLWQDALRVDPNHVESTYNLSLYEWRICSITDKEIHRRMEDVLKAEGVSRRDIHLLAKACILFGEYIRALDIFKKMAAGTEKPSREELRDRGLVLCALGAQTQETDTVEATGKASLWKEAEECCRHAMADGHVDLHAAVCCTLALKGQGRQEEAAESYRHWSSGISSAISGLPPSFEDAVHRYLPGYERVRTFEGHNGSVRAVAVSQDGRFVLSGGSEDMVLRYWDMVSGSCVHILSGHTDWVTGVAFYRDGKHLLSCSNDRTLRLWSLERGKCIRVFSGHTDWVTALALTPNGRYLLSSGNDGTVRIWEISTGKPLRVLQGHRGAVTSLAVTADGLYALSGGADGAVALWNVVTCKQLRLLTGHTGGVTSVLPVSGGRKILSGSNDSTIRLWDAASGRQEKVLKGHDGGIVSMAASAVSPLLLSSSTDNTLCLWDIATGQRLYVYKEQVVNAISFTPDGARAVAAVWNGMVVLEVAGRYVLPYCLAQPVSSSEAQRRENEFQTLIEDAGHAAREGRYTQVIELVDKARAVKGYERDREALHLLERMAAFYPRKRLANAWESAVFKGHSGPVNAADFSADGVHVASAGADGTVRVWDRETARILHLFKGHARAASAVAWTWDGSRIASAGADWTIALWEPGSEHPLQVYKGHTGAVTCLTAAPDGEHLLSGSEDETLRLWHLSKGSTIRIYRGHEASLTCAAISPDMRSFFSAGKEETVVEWDMDGKEVLRRYRMHNNSISCLAVAPDRSLIVAGGVFDGKLNVWSIQDGRPLKTLRGHKAALTGVDISPDGKFAISGSVDGTLRIWDLQTGICLRTFTWHTGGITCVKFSQDGGFFLCCNEDGALRIWQLDWELDPLEFQDRAEGIGEFLRIFLTLHTPRMESSFIRKGKPLWTEDDFQALLVRLGHYGYGWVRHEGVRAYLQEIEREMARFHTEESTHFLAIMDQAEELLKDGRHGESYAHVQKARSQKGYERNARALDLLTVLSGLLPKEKLLAAWKLRVFEGACSPITAVAFSPDGRFCYLGCANGVVEVRERERATAHTLFALSAGPVDALAATPEGRFLLCGGADASVSLWDLSTGTVHRTFSGHLSGVTAVSVTPDGHFALCAGRDKAVRVWHIESGSCMKTFRVPAGGILCLAVGPDGRQALAGGSEGASGLWDIQSGKRIHLFKGHKGCVTGAAFSPDGKWAATTGQEGTVRVWDLKTGNNIQTIDELQGPVRCLSISPDGAFLLWQTPHSGLCLWSLKSGQRFAAFEGNTAGLSHAGFTPDGMTVYGVDDEATLSLWHLDWELRVEKPAEWDEEAGPFLDLFLTLHTPAVAHTVYRRGVPVWDEDDVEALLQDLKVRGYGRLSREGVRARLTQLQEKRKDAALDLETNFKAMVVKARQFFRERDHKGALEAAMQARSLKEEGSGELARIFAGLSLVFPRKRLNTAWKVRTFEGFTGVTSVLMSLDGQSIIWGAEDKAVRVLDVKNKDKVRLMKGHEGRINALALSPEGRYLYSASGDGTLRRWDLPAGQCIHVFEGHEGDITTVTVSPEGKYAFSAGRDGTVRCWDVDSGQCLEVVKNHEGEATALAVSPEGLRVLSGGEDETLCLRQRAEERPLFRVKAHHGAVRTALFSPDGRYGLSGGQDGIIFLWDLQSAKTIYTLAGHAGPVSSLAVSPDSRYILSGSEDGSARLWEISSGESIHSFEGHSLGVTGVAFSREGNYLICGSMDCDISLWHLDWELEGRPITSWDEGAAPYLDIFLSLHSDESKMGTFLMRKPRWDEEDFLLLVEELKIRGFGWLHPEGVRKKLTRMAQAWKGKETARSKWLNKFFKS